jgi:hypothetical protein
MVFVFRGLGSDVLSPLASQASWEASSGDFVRPRRDCESSLTGFIARVGARFRLRIYTGVGVFSPFNKGVECDTLLKL